MTIETLNHADVDMTRDLAVAFLARSNIAASEIPAVLRTIYDGVVALGSGSAEKQVEALYEAAKPAEIRKSVTPDALISFIDGKPYKTLKRHLAKHGLDMAGYRTRYGLPADYPSTAQAYSEQRSALAKETGLGRTGRLAKAA